MKTARKDYRTPSEIVNSYLDWAPVDLDGLAKDLGIEVRHSSSLPNDISGKIERIDRGGRRFAITINARHHANRQRFTLAHEIAHFILHRDLIGDSVVDNAMYRSCLSDEWERQANRYAANLLMPARLVRAKHQAGILTASGMAAEFRVSPEAARIRMDELGLP